MPYSALEKEILQYINQYRTSIHLLPLSFDDTIQAAALSHSKQMATNKVEFGHEGFSERAERLLKQLHGTSAAENVALGQRSAQEVVDGWLSSPGHKKNIEGDFTLTGIAVATNTQGQYVFTQIFIKAPNSKPSSSQPNLTTPPSTETPNLNYLLLKQTNDYRQKNNLPILQLNPHLQVLATQHAQEMANNQVTFGHEGFNTRANKIVKQLEATAVAENIALGNDNANLVFDNWIESTPHQKNILGNFDWLGIGVAKSADDTFYYCQIFAKKQKL